MKLDDVDYARIWLPAGFSNFITGSPFLEMMSGTDKKAAYASRQQAVDAYIQHMTKANPDPL